jgi:hypothetical protein
MRKTLSRSYLALGNTFELMRASETSEKNETFLLPNGGALVRADHPFTVRGVRLLEEGREHYRIWKDLPDLIHNSTPSSSTPPGIKNVGKSSSMHGQLFGYTNDVRSSRIGLEEMHSIKSLCDLGGGQGHVICSILPKNDNIDEGIVLEVPSVVYGADKPLRGSEKGRQKSRSLFRRVKPLSR